MTERVEEMISGLVGFRIIDISDNGIKLRINASLFVENRGNPF